MRMIYLFTIFILILIKESENKLKILSLSDEYELVIQIDKDVPDKFNVTFTNGTECEGKVEIRKTELSSGHEEVFEVGKCGFLRFVGGSGYGDKNSFTTQLKFGDLKLLPSYEYQISTLGDESDLYLNYSFIKSIQVVSNTPTTFFIYWKENFFSGYSSNKFLVSFQSLSSCVASYILHITNIPVGSGGKAVCDLSNATSLSLSPSSNHNYSVNITNEALQITTNYTIVIQAGNSWGWGPPTSYVHGTVNPTSSPKSSSTISTLYTSNYLDTSTKSSTSMSMSTAILSKSTSTTEPSTSNYSDTSTEQSTANYSDTSTKPSTSITTTNSSISASTNVFSSSSPSSTNQFKSNSTTQSTLSTTSKESTTPEPTDYPIPENVTEEKLQQIMKKETIQPKDKTKQISVTLPLELFQQKSKIISKFSIVISIGSPITNGSISNASKFANDTYADCKDKSGCVYEILVNLTSKSNRRKRDVSQMNLENVGYLIGEMEGCENREHLCNGPLKSGQTYKIGLRVYGSKNYFTVGIIEKTSSSNLILIIGVCIAVLIFILIIIVVVVVKKRKPVNRFTHLISDTARPSFLSPSGLDEIVEHPNSSEEFTTIALNNETKSAVYTPKSSKTMPSQTTSIELMNTRKEKIRTMGNGNSGNAKPLPSIPQINAETTEIDGTSLDGDEINSIESDNGESKTDDCETNEYDLITKVELKGVSMKDFEENIVRLNENDQELLRNEYNNIRFIAQKAIEDERVVFVEYDKRKNRYGNVIPFTHNAVKINTPDKFINASRICTNRDHWATNCLCEEIYVAAQGPIGEHVENKESTITDFWRMIVEFNIDSIVMLTNVKESRGDKPAVVKCAQYWPKEGKTNEFVSYKKKYVIKTIKCVENDIYSERKIQIKLDKEKRVITQLHMKAWMDHSFPDDETFLIFYDRFCELRDRYFARRTVIHCSAGVGRTGSFILIDALARYVGSPNDYVSVYDALTDLRFCRPEMVQNLKQYSFVYKILLACFQRQRIIEIKPKPAKSIDFDDNGEEGMAYANLK